MMRNAKREKFQLLTFTVLPGRPKGLPFDSEQ